MELLPQELKDSLPKFQTMDCKPVGEIPIAAKFFTPDSDWTWYAVEGEPEGESDFVFYGLVDGFEREWGYFALSELQKVKGPAGFSVERDLYFTDKTIKDIE